MNNGEILNFYFGYLFRSQYLHSLMALTATELDLKKHQKRLDASVMALEALRNVIKNNSGIPVQALLWHVTPCVVGQKIV